MALLAEIELSSPTIFLGPTLEALPGVEIDLERQFALDPARPISFCWVRYDRPGRFERHLPFDHTVDAFEPTAESEQRTLYRIRRSDEGVIDFYGLWLRVGGELLDGRGSDGGWSFRIRFPDRESFATFRQSLESSGVEFDLERLSERRTPHGEDVLTDPQREALQLALEFFDVPRRTTLADLAASMEISDQAMSERLRRGHARLVEEYFGCSY